MSPCNQFRIAFMALAMSAAELILPCRSYAADVPEHAAVVESLEGTAEIVSPYRPTFEVSAGDILVAGERMISGGNAVVIIRLPLCARLELGMDSILEIPSPSRNNAGIFLMKGRVRARVKTGRVIVGTPTAEVSAGEGFCDIIISNFNTLAAPREGEAAVVSSTRARVIVPAGKNALAAVDGNVVISRE